MQRVTEPGGAAEIDADVHAEGFTTVAAGEPGTTDRLLDGRVAIPGRGRRVGHVSSGVGQHTITLAEGATKYVATAALIASEGVSQAAHRASESSSRGGPAEEIRVTARRWSIGTAGSTFSPTIHAPTRRPWRGTRTNVPRRTPIAPVKVPGSR